MKKMILDQKMETEFLRDVSRICFDFFTLFDTGNPVFQFLVIFGHIFSLISDYIPDKQLAPEEIYMFAISICIFSKSSRYVFFAHTESKKTVRNERAFRRLFEPSGLTRMQFQILLATACTWVYIEPGEKIGAIEDEKQASGKTSENYLYWVYRGDVDILNDHNHLVSTRTEKFGDTCSGEGIGLLGDIKFIDLYLLGKSKEHNLFPIHKDLSLYMKAGYKGVTLLHIGSEELSLLMENDALLENAIHSIMLKSLQSKFYRFNICVNKTCKIQ
eukprot:CAMPEP_0194271148 /NCGR_PEP_ID=MMETSP0169-20130528/5006_1 /TAXON_ID=218684 /ORGANISM="Corethron pennatum, Strain L29A3" /LENGTH=272 /DNA_ID=CAMNT_0039013433 /DNA_START=370 /DNA_END=1188 /DNA_ORIENTATION=-